MARVFCVLCLTWGVPGGTLADMTDPLHHELTVQIRAEMRRQGLTITALAQRIGVPPRTLQARLAARGGLRVAHLTAICDALGVSPATLTARAEQVAA